MVRELTSSWKVLRPSGCGVVACLGTVSPACGCHIAGIVRSNAGFGNLSRYLVLAHCICRRVGGVLDKACQQAGLLWGTLDV